MDLDKYKERFITLYDELRQELGTSQDIRIVIYSTTNHTFEQMGIATRSTNVKIEIGDNV